MTAATQTLRSWRMPAEAAPQERIWMAYPTEYTRGITADADSAREAWTATALAASMFTPVTMLVDPTDMAAARNALGSAVELIEAPLDDAWTRDIGPTFVTDGDALGAVCWVFNGWGQQADSWQKDARIGRVIAEAAGAEVVESALVNEGGAIHVDGEGTVLATETVQLDPHRNPDLSHADVEAEFARTIGTQHTVWLPRGLTRDYEPYGTRGHIDMIATFAAPGRVLLHDQRDPAHPDHEISALLRGTLAEAADAQGRSLEVIDLPAPSTLRDAEGFVDWSYVNHLVTNDGVIACSYGDEAADDRARGILAEAYGLEVVSVDARPILARGGGIHCITQQQPKLGAR